MTPTLCGVGIHSLFTGNVQSAGKEQSGKYKGESREPRNHGTADILWLCWATLGGVKWAGGRHATLHVLQPEMVSPLYRFIMDLISISKSSKPLLPFLSPVLKVTLKEGNCV